MSRQVVINVHSTQKLKETGYGGISKAIPNGKNMTDEEVAVAKKAIQEAQRAENEIYKGRIKAGEVVEQKYFKRTPGVKPDAPADTQVQAVILQDVPHPIAVIPPAGRLANDYGHVRTPFDLKLDQGTGNTMYVIGSTKRGKSTAIMKIYDRYYADRKSVNILWTENPHIKLYRGHENLIVADRWDPGSEAIVKMQHQIQTKTKNAYRFLNILDDVPHVRGSKIVEKMFMIYRNSKMSCIVSMQAAKQLMKNCRSNTSNILLFGANDDESIEAIIRCFLSGYLRAIGIRDISDQINWYKSATADHAFIYLHPSTGEVSFHRFQL